MPPPSRAEPTGRVRPPGRYDEPSRTGSRAVAVVLGALFLAFLLALSWTLYQRYGDTDELQSRVIGFTVTTDDVVRVEFDVTPPAGGTAWCLVRARNAAGEEVGRDFLPVAPDDDGGAVRVRHELATRDRAVTGEVQSCLPRPPPDGEPTAEPATPVSP